MKLGEIIVETKEPKITQRVTKAVNAVGRERSKVPGLSKEQLKRYIKFRDKTKDSFSDSDLGFDLTPSQQDEDRWERAAKYEEHQLALQTAVWLVREIGRSDPKLVRRLIHYRPWRDWSPAFVDQLKTRIRLKYWGSASVEFRKELQKLLDKEFGEGKTSLGYSEDDDLVVYVERPQEAQVARNQRMAFKENVLQVVRKFRSSYERSFVEWVGMKGGSPTIHLHVVTGEKKGQKLGANIVNDIERSIPNVDANFSVETLEGEFWLPSERKYVPGDLVRIEARLAVS